MQISSRFTIAVHVLIAIETFKKDHKITSEFLASSANVNPTVIRRLLQQLKKADEWRIRTLPFREMVIRKRVLRLSQHLHYKIIAFPYELEVSSSFGKFITA